MLNMNQNERVYVPDPQVLSTELGNLSNLGKRYFPSIGNEFISEVRKMSLYRSIRGVMNCR